MRFQYRDSTFCFICTHLAAHRGNVAGRNSDYANILDKLVFKADVVPNSGTGVGGGAGGEGPLGGGASRGDRRGGGDTLRQGYVEEKTRRERESVVFV